jgi:AAA domain
VPPKRRWLHGTDLVRGAVSLLVAPGARGKSSWLVTLALACASNQPLLGAKIFGGPLRVLLISAEDPLSELALRIRAAMQHYGLTDADVPGLHVIGADHWGVSLLRPATHGPILDKAGWDELNAELDHLEPDILIIDPLISVMGGASQNDNAAAALFMGQLVGLAAKHRIAVMVAHHSAKGRDPISAESAMGAASFVNLSRIALGIEPLAEKDAGSVGLPPWEARQVFRLVSTKHNQSPPAECDRWFRTRSVEMNNEQPPIYPDGDKVAVVEVFQPSASTAAFSSQNNQRHDIGDRYRCRTAEPLEARDRALRCTGYHARYGPSSRRARV